MSNDDYFLQAVFNAAATRTYRAAVSAGLTKADREDLHQSIVLDLLERSGQFDPTRGSAGTFTGMISEHLTADFLGALNRDRAKLTFFSAREAANDDEFSPSSEVAPDGAEPLWADDSDLFAESETLRDIQTALSYLNDKQACLFELLVAHQDLPAAAKASGMASATFYRRVADLQMHLRMFGIRSAA